MHNLQKVMDSYIGSVCALGDMNTIPDLMNDCVRSAVANDKYELMLNNVCTFFGSFYDTVDVGSEITEWTCVLGQDDKTKYSILEHCIPQKSNTVV